MQISAIISLTSAARQGPSNAPASGSKPGSLPTCCHMSVSCFYSPHLNELIMPLMNPFCAPFVYLVIIMRREYHYTRTSAGPRLPLRPSARPPVCLCVYLFISRGSGLSRRPQRSATLPLINL